MPNYNFSSTLNVNTITASETASLQGNIYLVSIGIVQIPKNEYLAICIRNPSDSGKVLNLGNICASSVVQASFVMYRNLPITEGITITPKNANNQFGDNCVATAEYKLLTNDPTGGSEILFSGFIQDSGVTIYPCDGNVQIAANTSMTMLIHNRNTSNDGYVGFNTVLIQS